MTAKQLVDNSLREIEAVSELADGLYSGITWSNTKLIVDKKDQLYCQPAKLGINRSQFITIIDKYISDFPQFSDKPAGMVAVLAMRYAFPCSPENK